MRPYIRAALAMAIAMVAGVAHADAPATAPAPAAAPARAPARAPAGSSCDAGFFSRLAQGYSDDASGNAPSTDYLTPTSGRRALPAPLSSPPFPSSEWQLGGVDYPIGVPDENPRGPLQQALGCDALGKWMDDNRIEVSGWLNPSANLSTSHTTNYPVSYITAPNALVFDQAVFSVARLPDTVQTDHIDWGFHFDMLYGYDYHYTAAQGVLSYQLEENKYYGLDPMIFYGDIYIPGVAQGMQITVGRFLSLPDIEAQFSPQNYLMTHSVLYTVDPYTQMGVITTTKLNDNWTFQLGVNCSPDTACWESDRTLSYSSCVRWVSSDNSDMLYPCINNWNRGDANYNNVQMTVLTWGHRFSDDVFILTEAYRMYERDVPGFPPGNVPEYGAVNYLNIKLSDKTFLSIRNEYYNDAEGQRTGFATHYSSHTVGCTHWATPDLELRPELRFDHSYNLPAYDHGTKNNQLVAAFDVIAHY